MAAKKKSARKAGSKKATRKKASKKKSTRKKKAARKKGMVRSALARIEPDLPPTLRDYSKDVRKQLTKLEKDVASAQASASKRGTKLIREASEMLGRLEERGERQWRKLSAPYRRDAVKLLEQMQKAIAPPKKKKSRRKKKA